jgi:hypothetical protein
MLKYSDLENKPRELLAATGLTRPEFEALLKAFEKCYQQSQPADQTLSGQPRQRRQGGGTKSKLETLADKLLFITIYHKTYPLQTMHGLQFGLTQGRVNEWVQRLMPLLLQALADIGQMPVRTGEAVADSPLAQVGGADLLIDGTERRQQRPQEASRQQAHYSGKKKPTPSKI